MTTERRTLLAVDDEPDLLDFVERVFRKRYTVQRADGADQALARLASGPVHVLVADQRLEGMSGLELLERVAEDHGDITRVLLSGFADLPETNQATEVGLVHAYVVKPLDADRLTEAVDEAVARHEQGDWT